MRVLYILPLVSLVASSQVVRKDGTFSSLVEIFNNNTELFENWGGSEANFERLIKSLSPWVIGQPLELPSRFRPAQSIDCNDPAYRGVLTGKKLDPPIPRTIVDFIPFGYDIDKLEIRFHETFEAVDIYVIYETTRTQSGLAKPLFFSDIQYTPRFKRWMSKVIYIKAGDTDIESFLQETRKGLKQPNKVRSKNSWSLEKVFAKHLSDIIEKLFRVKL